MGKPVAGNERSQNWLDLGPQNRTCADDTTSEEVVNATYTYLLILMHTY